MDGSRTPRNVCDHRAAGVDMPPQMRVPPPLRVHRIVRRIIGVTVRPGEAEFHS